MKRQCLKGDAQIAYAGNQVGDKTGAHLGEGTLKLKLLEGAGDDILHALAALHTPKDV